MKNLLFAALALTSTCVFADMKVGTVDLMTLVKSHPDYDRNKTLMESTDKDYQAKLDVIKEEGEKMQAEGKKLMEQFRNPMLNDKAKGELEKKISDLQQKLIGVEQRYRSKAMSNRQELQDLEGRLLKATTEDLRKRIDKYATAKGYDFIFDKNAAPYSKACYDITDDILKDMGVSRSKATVKADKKASAEDEGK